MPEPTAPSPATGAPSPSHAALVFVYGTLKRGGSNHALMHGQHFLGAARTTPGFTLYALDTYPGLVAAPADQSGVTGEIWGVDAAALLRLDELEGLDEGLYARVPAPLAEAPATLSAPDLRRVEMYLYLRDVSKRTYLGPFWPVATV